VYCIYIYIYIYIQYASRNPAAQQIWLESFERRTGKTIVELGDPVALEIGESARGMHSSWLDGMKNMGQLSRFVGVCACVCVCVCVRPEGNPRGDMCWCMWTHVYRGDQKATWISM